MNEIVNWYKVVVTERYVQFSGRAMRSEFWSFALVNFGISLVLAVVDAILGTNGNGLGVIGGLYSLAVFLPSIAVSIRRLHDTNRSGWWQLVSLVPVVGGLVMLVLYLLSGTPGANRFGEPPAAG